MSSLDKNSKSFKFVGAAKFPRKVRAKDIKKHPFVIKTMKVKKLISPPQIEKKQKVKEIKNINTLVIRDFNNSEEGQFVYVNYYSNKSPVNLVVKTNFNDSILGKFVLEYFSTASKKMNKNRVNQLIGLVSPWEKGIMARLLSNRLITKLKYPFDPPVYRGSALGSTKIENIDPNFTDYNLAFIGDSLTPLESHLIYLYFKYISLANTCAHYSYFNFRLNHDWKETDFQSLLAIILCCACPYLTLEPFETPINISKLSEYYFHRSQTLYSMIDLDTPSINICKILITLLRTSNDYSCWVEACNKIYKTMSQMNWYTDFARSKDEILRSKPMFDTREFYLWEQKLFVWCSFNYHLSTVLISRVEIEGLDSDHQIPSILSGLEALYNQPGGSKWTTSHEGLLCYYQFKSQPIIERARIFSKKSSRTRDILLSPTTDQLEELYYIKQINNYWKNEFTQYCESRQFDQGKLAIATGLYLYYHYHIVLCILPFLPRTAAELNDPRKSKLFSEFMLSATSIALLMDCQGTWMVIIGIPSKDLIVSIAWSGVRICLNFLEDLKESQLSSTIDVIKHLADVLNTIMISKLTTCWSFRFRKQLNATVTEKRSLLMWPTICQTSSSSNRNSISKPAFSCELPPKLSNNSKLKLLN